MKNFIGRDTELEYLESEYSKKQFHNIILYGRRRVGKTTLCTQFLKNKPGTYFLSQKTENQAQKLTDKFCKENNIFPEKTPTFEESFRYITNTLKGKQYIIIIDEFPYLVENDDTIPSQFQFIIDEILKESNIFLILLGSSISIIENEILAYKSPLYGRRTGQIKLKPLNMKDYIKYFPHKNMTEIVELYGVYDAIPAYLQVVDKEKDIFDNITETILKKERFLYEEPEFLLRQELREPKNYLEILKAISAGKSKLSDISDEVHIPTNILTKYINSLLTLELIKKEFPVGEKELRRHSIYEFKDNFLRFYFTFIYPNKTLIEEGKIDVVKSSIKKGLPTYLGKVFEDICKIYITQTGEYQKIGRYWNKETEIDIIGIHEKKTDIFECKYQIVNYTQELNKLKAKKVPFTNPNYFIIAKEFSGKEKGISLQDIYTSFKKS